MSFTTIGWNSRQLYFCSTWDSKKCQKNGWSNCTHRWSVEHTRVYARSFNSSFFLSAPLSAHLDSQNVEFMQFAFRWMNCLLMREISVQNTIRMWDTYLVSKIFPYFKLKPTNLLLVGWRPWCIFSIPPLCLFSVLGTLERKIEKNGLSGRPSSFWYQGFFFFKKNLCLGYYHVLAIFTNTRLGRSWNWDASQRGIRVKFDMAQRAKSL